MNDSDVLISYEGCGCAGGQVTTIQGEQVAEGRRTQKSYEDILGRTYKSEVLNWNGTVYSTTTQSFDGRDQAIEAKQFAGPDTSTVFQTTTATYDGVGRLKTQHLPEQDANTSTSFDYNADDTLHIKTDARGATATNTYNNLGLLTNISYQMPGAPPPPPTGRTNFALYNYASGGQTFASSSYEENNHYYALAAITGGRTGEVWGQYGGWMDGTPDDFSNDWIMVSLHGRKTIDEINVVTLQDDYNNPVEPTESMTFSTQGITDFEVQYQEYYTGDLEAGWITIPNGTVTGNNKVWRRFTFPAVTAAAIRVKINGALNHSSRVVELEAIGNNADNLPPSLNTSVSFGYDNLGHRTSMTDELGTKSYEYNELGQMKAETRNFTGYLPNAPAPNNGFKLEYAYALNGQLKSYKDPWGEQINYAFDKVGRLNSVTGTTFGGITNYAGTPTYNARGVLTHLNYGNGVEMNITNFNNKLQATDFDVKKGATELIKKNYQFYDDGSLSYMQDVLDPKFDRLNTYDHVGRISEAKTSTEARGTPPSSDYWFNRLNLPSRQSYQYDAFSNLTHRSNLHWGSNDAVGIASFDLNATFQNNRRNGVQYDADGREILFYISDTTYQVNTYNAAGQAVIVDTSENIGPGQWRDSQTNHKYDGDGLANNGIRSTVMGGQIISTTGDGPKIKTNVYAAGTILAVQQKSANTAASVYEDVVYFAHYDAAEQTAMWTRSNGEKITKENSYDYYQNQQYFQSEADGFGSNVGLKDPYWQENPDPPEPLPPNPYAPYQNDGVGIGTNPNEPLVIINGLYVLLSDYWRRHGQNREFDILPWAIGFQSRDDSDRSWGYNYGSSSSRSKALALVAAGSSIDCLNAILGAVPANMLAYANTAVSALDNATTGIGYTWAQFAYLLATTEHESRFGAPTSLSFSVSMEEDWNVSSPTPAQRGYEGSKSLGNTQPGDGYRYRGRGYVQITGRGNYARLSNLIPNSLVPNILEDYPDFAAMPYNAAVIAAQGLQNDLFTQQGRSIGNVINSGTFADFLSARDFIGARYVREGKKKKKTDVGTKIANRALDYFSAMRGICF